MAELNVFANKLQKELTCSICGEIFTNPRTLRCLHSFCLQCISDWSDSCSRERRSLTCPSCRSVERLEGNDVSSLPSSFHLHPQLQLLRDVRLAAENQTRRELADCVCCKQQSKLVAFCPQYQGLLCAKCVTGHENSTPMEERQETVFPCDFKVQDANSYIRNCLYCQERYCSTCKECICSVCNAERHKLHHTVTLKEVAEEVKVVIQRDMDRVNKVKEKFEEELKLSKQNMARMEQETSLEIKKVSDEVLKYIKVLRERKTAVIETLQRKLEQQKSQNNEEQRLIKDFIKSISEFNHQGQALLDENIAAHYILKSQQERSQRCETFLRKTSILSGRPAQRNASVRYIPNPQVIQGLQDIGKVVESVIDPSRCFIENLNDITCGFVNIFEVVTRNPQNELCATGLDSIGVQIQDGDGINVEKEVSQSQTGKYTVKYRAEIPCDYTIHVRINGQEIKNSPQTVTSHDIRREFKPVKIFGGKGCEEGQLSLNLPRSLAVSDSGEIAAIADCGNHRIVIFSADGEYLRHFGEEGTEDGQLCNPFDVVFNDDRLLVTDNSKNTGRLQEFDPNGTYCKTIYKQRGIELQGMCTADDNIAVCFRELNGKNPSGIKLLNKRSWQVVQEIPCADQDEEVPWCIAYGNGKYFVSYPFKDYICVFNRNGLFLYKFGEKGNGDGQFDRPRGLAVISDVILVCDGNDRVQMLNQDGQFIMSFGRHGSCLGEMNGPMGIAVSPDGRVFVLEWGNHRVHVWRP